MQNILDRIKKIEALIAGTNIEGERQAAISAKERILQKHPMLEILKDAKEYYLHTQGSWHKKLLLALCRKYGLNPYRYHRQKYTTVVVRINEGFLNQVLWKEFQECSKHLEALVDEVTDDLIQKIHRHEEEEVVIQGELNG